MDNDIKAWLRDSLLSPPAKHFNERVLHQVPAVPPKKRHYISLDEPWLMVWSVVLLIMGCCLYFSGRMDNNILLLLLGALVLGIFVMLFNKVTRAALKTPR